MDTASLGEWGHVPKKRTHSRQKPCCKQLFTISY